MTHPLAWFMSFHTRVRFLLGHIEFSVVSKVSCGFSSLVLVELLTDNATCVSVINSQHSSKVFMQRCLRELWLLLALHNIQLSVRSVRGCDNWLADSLSRFHTGNFCSQFNSLAADLSLTECSVPDSLFLFAVE